MPDDVALRSRRSKLHRRGDHSLCRAGRCGALSEPKPGVAVPVGESRLVEAYRERLEAADRLESAEGEHVMALVSAMGRGGHSASSLAALSRELRAAMQQALNGSVRVADPVDEVQAMRRRRRGS